MRAWHWRHFPLWIRNDRTGISSNGVRVCLHFGQADLGDIMDCLSGTRRPTTL